MVTVVPDLTEVAHDLKCPYTVSLVYNRPLTIGRVVTTPIRNESNSLLADICLSGALLKEGAYPTQTSDSAGIFCS